MPEISLNQIRCHGNKVWHQQILSPPDLSLMLPSAEQPAVSTAMQHPDSGEGTVPLANTQKDTSPISCKGFPSPTWTSSFLKTVVQSFSTTAPLDFGLPTFIMLFHKDLSSIWYTSLFSPNLPMHFHSSAPQSVSKSYLRFLKGQLEIKRRRIIQKYSSLFNLYISDHSFDEQHCIFFPLCFISMWR